MFEARSISDFSWSADSARLVFVESSSAPEKGGSSVWIADPLHPDRAEVVYRAAISVEKARLCPDPRWLAVTGTDTRPGAAGFPFHVVAIDLEKKAEIAHHRMRRSPPGWGPAWTCPGAELLFPQWDDEGRRIGRITITGDSAKQDVLRTARAVLSVYPDLSGRRIYYCHLPADLSARNEGLSVLDVGAGTDTLLAGAVSYHQVAVSPTGSHAAYVGPDKRLHVIDASSGRDTVIAHGVDNLWCWTTADRIVFRVGQVIRSATPSGSQTENLTDLDALADAIGLSVAPGG